MCLVRRLGKIERVVQRRGGRSGAARDEGCFARSCWRMVVDSSQEDFTAGEVVIDVFIRI